MNVNILETDVCEGLVAHRLRTRCLLTGLLHTASSGNQAIFFIAFCIPERALPPMFSCSCMFPFPFLSMVCVTALISLLGVGDKRRSGMHFFSSKNLEVCKERLEGGKHRKR